MAALFAFLFPGTVSSMAIKLQNFQRAYLKDFFLCSCCEYFLKNIYSILGELRRVNLKSDICLDNNWQEIPYVRSEHNKNKLT